mmetsp:Transcript_35613/g.95728  ORF Transcript_35613/g.95728 Transcript_35613/m.95728 type:complete len:292 (+) Transcript_35613:66-941(+)
MLRFIFEHPPRDQQARHTWHPAPSVCLFGPVRNDGDLRPRTQESWGNPGRRVLSCPREAIRAIRGFVRDLYLLQRQGAPIHERGDPDHVPVLHSDLRERAGLAPAGQGAALAPLVSGTARRRGRRRPVRGLRQRVSAARASCLRLGLRVPCRERLRDDLWEVCNGACGVRGASVGLRVLHQRPRGGADGLPVSAVRRVAHAVAVGHRHRRPRNARHVQRCWRRHQLGWVELPQQGLRHYLHAARRWEQAHQRAPQRRDMGEARVPAGPRGAPAVPAQQRVLRAGARAAALQ